MREQPIGETVCPRPVNPYGKTKLAVETGAGEHAELRIAARQDDYAGRVQPARVVATRLAKTRWT